MKALAQKIHQNLSYCFRALELLILSRGARNDFLPWKSSIIASLILGHLSPRPTESPNNYDEQLGPGLCSCESRVHKWMINDHP